MLMSLTNYDDLLRFELQEDFHAIEDIDEDGDRTYAICFGKSIDEEGDECYAFEAGIQTYAQDEAEPLDIEDIQGIRLAGNFANVMRIVKKSFVVYGMSVVSFALLGFVRHSNKTYIISSVLAGEDNLKGWVDFLNALLATIVIDGKKGDFGALTEQMLLELPDKSERYPKATPNAGQHTHFDFLHNSTGLLSMFGGLVNQNGTEYCFEQIDEDFIDRFDNAKQLRNIAQADKTKFELADRARKMGEIFRVSKAAFNDREDREQELAHGLVRRCEMYEAFRSFAWTLAAHCSKENIQPADVSIETLEDIANFVVDDCGRLNYTADSFCPVLCSGDDIHNYYISDATSPKVRAALIACLSEEAGEGSDYDPEVCILSLDGLRKDLEYLYPAMQTIHDAFAQTRDRNEQLEGALAEVLYVWCSATYAARTPIYTEDGPMNCAWDHPETSNVLERLMAKKGDYTEEDLALMDELFKNM